MSDVLVIHISCMYSYTSFTSFNIGAPILCDAMPHCSMSFVLLKSIPGPIYIHIQFS